MFLALLPGMPPLLILIHWEPMNVVPKRDISRTIVLHVCSTQRIMHSDQARSVRSTLHHHTSPRSIIERTLGADSVSAHFLDRHCGELDLFR